MARTTYEFQIKSPNMMNDIHAYLMEQGFQYIKVKGENIYRKNVGYFTFLSFMMQIPTGNLTFQVMGKNAVMEAWIAPAMMGVKELPIKSSVGFLPKNREFYDNTINYIEHY